MNTMEVTKIFGALCGSLLIFLLLQIVGEGLYHVDHGVIAYEIEVAEVDVNDEEEEEIDIEALMAEADPAAGEAVWRRCTACHTLEAGQNRAGPYLYGVVGREIAAVDGFSYSAALEGIDGVWDYEALYGFLRDPRGWAPGTTMNFAGLTSSADLVNIIAYMEQHGSN